MTGTPRSYFEDQYRQRADPWGLATRWYEARKYDLTVAALPRRRYRHAFEPGCSVGVLTERLAARCDAVLATDLMEPAVVEARRRNAGHGGVTVEVRTLPAQWPDATFDLLVLSEFAYYFDAETLRGLLRTAAASLEDGATIVAVHWRGETDYPLTGDATHELIGATSGLESLSRLREPAFCLDVWEYHQAP